MLLNNIKILAKKRGVSLDAVEVGAGIGKKTLWRWNDISPSIAKLQAVAAYFGVTVDELLRENNEAV